MYCILSTNSLLEPQQIKEDFKNEKLCVELSYPQLRRILTFFCILDVDLTFISSYTLPWTSGFFPKFLKCPLYLIFLKKYMSLCIQ